MKSQVISICLFTIIATLVGRNLMINQINYVTNHLSNNASSIIIKQHTAKTNGQPIPLHQIYYRGISGLGHRLVRQAAAFHMAFRLYGMFDYMDVDWKNCPDENGKPPMFRKGHYRSNKWDTLVGPEKLEIPYHDFTDEAADQMGIDFRRSECPVKDKSVWESKNITQVIDNDMPGYSPRHTVLIEQSERGRKYYLSKKITDELFYGQLRDRFIRNHKTKVTSFLSKNDFSSHIVIGLHIRIGSHNDKDFHSKNRNITDLPLYIGSLTARIVEFCEHQNLTSMGLPIMLFVASDRPSKVKDLLQDNFNKTDVPITIRYYDQEEYMFDGYSFHKLEGGGLPCLQSWENTMMDMVLLSLADIVIAGRYTSFVQSMPLSMAFSDVNYFPDKPKNVTSSTLRDDGIRLHRFPPYCEVSKAGNGMICHKTYESMLSFHSEINETTFYYGALRWTLHRKEYMLPYEPHKCNFCLYYDLKDLCLLEEKK